MPYQGEYAGYQALRRVAESDQVKTLLSRCKTCTAATGSTSSCLPAEAPQNTKTLPRFVLAIDGSDTEVPVKTGYPGARVGYCTVASVLIDLNLVDKLDSNRPIEPRKYRETHKAAAIDVALPGSNVVTRRQTSARVSFREELFDHLQAMVIDEDDPVPLIKTYEALLSLKPKGHLQKCPYESDGCANTVHVECGCNDCTACHKPVFSTDALRIHERFNDLGTNGETFAYVRQILERILLVHILRCLEKRKLLDGLSKMVFFLDGPLAVFGPPAWLSAAISYELKRINALVRKHAGTDLIIVGIEKTGEFVVHFDEIDQTETPGKSLFKPRDYLLMTDTYIKERIQQTTSTRRYGQDTYFGRKFFYKTKTGARIVGNIPFLDEAQDTIDTDDVTLYPQFAATCELLDKLVSSRYPNAVEPIVSAHAEASIPLNLGSKVLKQLAQALMRIDH